MLRVRESRRQTPDPSAWRDHVMRFLDELDL